MPSFLFCEEILSHLTDWAQVLIAIGNLFFVIYIFTYQRHKDTKDQIRLISIQDQAIRLQWFKELIVQPHLEGIYSFYQSISKISEEFIDSQNDDGNILIMERIKTEQSILRKSFIDLLRVADPALEQSVKKNLDDLTDYITDTVYNKKPNLRDPTIFQQEIMSRITYSKNDLVKSIYSFKA